MAPFILPLTFLVSFAIVCGVYWLLVVRLEVASRDAAIGRLRGPRVARRLELSETTIVKNVERLTSIPALDRVFARAGDVPAGLQGLLNSADVPITVGRFVLASLVLAAFTYVVVVFFLSLYGIGLILAALAAALPTLYVRRRRAARFRTFEEQFPDAIDLIARAMRAGHGLSVGIGMAADELPQPVAREFRILYDWQNFGMSLPDALHRFAERVPILDARFFATAVLTQRESGGNLAEVLDNLARVIRERFRVKRQIRVLSTHGRMTGAVLAGMPPALAFYFLITKPDYITELATDPLGVKMVIGALALQILGMLIIRRLVDIEY